MSKSNNKKLSRVWLGIILFLTLIILTPAAWVTYRILTNPTQLIPYPYRVHIANYSGLEQAEKATVLIVGDRMGKAIENYLPLLIEKSSVHLKTPLAISNWAQEHENLARTLAKLRALKKVPPVVIYHGASEELYERRFSVNDAKAVLKNFSKQENVKLMSLIITAPILSRLIYNPTKLVTLGPDIKRDDAQYSAEARQLQAELSFKIFQAELQDLIQWSKEHKTQLVLVSTPINLEALPHQVCDNTTSENLKSYQDELASRIAKDDFKLTSAELTELTQKIIGNALNFHMLGTVYLKTGQMARARQEFIKAAAYDCSPWRTNPIHNILIEKYARQENIHFVDFDKLVNKNLGLDATFISEIYPQHVYYQQITEILAQKIIEVLHI